MRPGYPLRLPRARQSSAEGNSHISRQQDTRVIKVDGRNPFGQAKGPFTEMRNVCLLSPKKGNGSKRCCLGFPELIET